MSYRTSPTGFLTPNLIRGQVYLQGRAKTNSQYVIPKNSLVAIVEGLVVPVSALADDLAGASAAFLGVAMEGSDEEDKMIEVALKVAVEYLLETPNDVYLGDPVQLTLNGGASVADTVLEQGSDYPIGFVLESSTPTAFSGNTERVLVYLRSALLDAETIDTVPEHEHEAPPPPP